MKINVNKLYDKFTVDECIQLSVAALARNDKVEIKKLISSCPKKNYLATDGDYSDKMIAIDKICYIFLCICQHYIYKRDYCISAISVLEVAISLSAASEMQEDMLGKLKCEISELESIKNTSILELHSLYESVREFCQLTSINFNYVIQISELETLYPGEVNRICSMPEVNEELKGKILGKLIEIWEA